MPSAFLLGQKIRGSRGVKVFILWWVTWVGRVPPLKASARRMLPAATEGFLPLSFWFMKAIGYCQLSSLPQGTSPPLLAGFSPPSSHIVSIESFSILSSLTLCLRSPYASCQDPDGHSTPSKYVSFLHYSHSPYFFFHTHLYVVLEFICLFIWCMYSLLIVSFMKIGRRLILFITT